MYRPPDQKSPRSLSPSPTSPRKKVHLESPIVARIRSDAAHRILETAALTAQAVKAGVTADQKVLLEGERDRIERPFRIPGNGTFVRPEIS